MTSITEGTLLWQPSAQQMRDSRMQAYIDWLAAHKGLRFDGYAPLWEWSAAQPGDFWQSIWEFFDIRASTQPAQALLDRDMPGARWFEGARLNYAEHAFRNRSAERPALVFQSELQPLVEISWDELERQVAAVAAGLRAMGAQYGFDFL